MRNSRFCLLAAATALSVLLSGCSQSKYPVRTYPLGDRVELGHIIYMVFERQWLTQIGEGVSARIPQNRFFLVRMSATNSGGSELILPNVVLVDDHGNTYDELSNGDGVSGWIGYLRQVKPAEAAQGNLLFDCPPQHYRLRITDEERDRTALIDLPLSFDTETPEIPIPGQGKK